MGSVKAFPRSAYFLPSLQPLHVKFSRRGVRMSSDCWRWCPPRTGMSFADQVDHAQALCIPIPQISEEQTVTEMNSPNTVGSSATSAKFSEAASLRDDSHSADHSSSAIRLREELSRLKSDLDALMSHASTLTETELREARDRIIARFSSVRYMAYNIVAQAGQRISHGKNMTLDYVRSKPFQSVAIAATAGLLLGIWVRRE